jgi:Protein of unknown function (DUF3297)
MTDTLPDRLSNNPRSPFFQEDVLKRDIGVRFNGAEKTNVEEYCISEGWVRVEVGKTKDRYGNPMTIKLNGRVEPYFKDQKSEQPAEAETEQKPAKEEKPATEKTAKVQEPAKPEKPAQSKKTPQGATAGKAKSGKADTKSGKADTKKKKK